MTKEVPQMRSGPWLLKSRQLLPPPNMKNSTGTGLDQQNCKSSQLGTHWKSLQRRRPWNKANAIFLGAMRDIAKLSREAFDIRGHSWNPVEVNSPPLSPQGMSTSMVSLASVTIGPNWVVKEARMKSVVLHPVLEDA